MVVGRERLVGPPSTMSGNTVADLVAHTGGVGTLRRALKIRRSGRDGQTKAFDHGARNSGVGNAKGDVPGVGSGAQRQLRAGAHNDGQRPRPESVGKLVEHRVGVASQFVGLGERRRSGARAACASGGS